MGRTIKRLYGPAQVATGPTTVYTVPALTTARVTHVHVHNPSGSPVTLTLSIGADAAGTRLISAQSIPAAAAGVTGNMLDWYWSTPMTTGEILTLSAGTNNILTIVIDGEEYVAG